jgi:uncharacterized cupin superfamily protein
MKNSKSPPHFLKSSDIEAMPEKVFTHKLNSQAVRHTKSLSDAVGMSHLGIHLVRVETGKESTQFHFHHQEEEFIYIISGRGIAEIGEVEFEVAAGDFMGFTAPSLSHCLKNPFEEDLVYLMGGERQSFDVTDYPRLKQRMFRIDSDRQLVDWDNLQPL